MHPTHSLPLCIWNHTHMLSTAVLHSNWIKVGHLKRWPHSKWGHFNLGQCFFLVTAYQFNLVNDKECRGVLLVSGLCSGSSAVKICLCHLQVLKKAPGHPGHPPPQLLTAQNKYITQSKCNTKTETKCPEQKFQQFQKQSEYQEQWNLCM